MGRLDSFIHSVQPPVIMDCYCTVLQTSARAAFFSNSRNVKLFHNLTYKRLQPKCKIFQCLTLLLRDPTLAFSYCGIPTSLIPRTWHPKISFLMAWLSIGWFTQFQAASS
mmetsp:Transcript_44143/g.106376  ORF Transcript_44143/g.106376 Transcript_44143/m.106376 type:complete len:110 (-) Transcript_44143:689-1018(-)